MCLLIWVLGEMAVTGETIGGRSLMGVDRRHEGTAVVAEDNTYMVVINEVRSSV